MSVRGIGLGGVTLAGIGFAGVPFTGINVGSVSALTAVGLLTCLTMAEARKEQREVDTGE